MCVWFVRTAGNQVTLGYILVTLGWYHVGFIFPNMVITLGPVSQVPAENLNHATGDARGWYSVAVRGARGGCSLRRVRPRGRSVEPRSSAWCATVEVEESNAAL